MNLHKNYKSSYIIKEDIINLIEMHNKDKASLCFVNERQTGYDDQRWVEKSNLIKARDNYTCQLCLAFNPMAEGGMFIKQGEFYTLHYYDWEKNKYIIGVQDYDLSINFDFTYGFHLAMPRFNVHHKIYYRNRKIWDYQDDCLVTLCEYCHHYIHSLTDVGIPIVEERKDGTTKLIGKTRPKPYELNHTDLGTFQPFALVKENKWGIGLKGQDLKDFWRAKNENKKWFDYYDLLNDNVVHIAVFNDPNNMHEYEETKVVIDFIITDFFERILGFSKMQQ